MEGVREKMAKSRTMKQTIKMLAWCLLVVCFFLPFGKACEKVQYPYKVALGLEAGSQQPVPVVKRLLSFGQSPPSLWSAMVNLYGVAFPFLFPVVFALVKAVLDVLPSRQSRLGALRALAIIFLLIAALSFVAWWKEFDIERDYRKPINLMILISFASLLIEMALDLPKVLKKEPLPFLIYQVTFFAAIWIFWWFFAVEQKMAGAWLALSASCLAFVLATWDYVRTNLAGLKLPKQS